MLRYQIYQSQLKNSMSFGKWYARPVTYGTVNLKTLSEHMKAHNTPYSAGTIRGILEDAVACTRELLLDGKRVQLDGLASFGLSIVHKMGADTADMFNVRSNIMKVKLVAQGIGGFNTAGLTNAINLQESRSYVSPQSSTTDSGSSDSGSSGSGTEEDLPPIIDENGNEQGPDII